MSPPLTIGILVFPGVTLLDVAGPYEIFSRIPHAQVSLVWKNLQAVHCDTTFTISPTETFSESSKFSVLFVAGGPGQIDLMEDQVVMDWLRRSAQSAELVSSVCTGSLLLAAAGLLKGYRATTHWLSHDVLTLLGAISVRDRIVRDRNRLTAAGVSAGLDVALFATSLLRGEELARDIQLTIEYDPAPPFKSGHPSVAHPETVERVTRSRQAIQSRRLEQARKIASTFHDAEEDSQ